MWIEIISGGASFLLSAFTSILDANHKRKMEQDKFNMSLIAAQHQQNMEFLKMQNEVLKNDPHFAITRRFIALGVTFGVLGAMLFLPALFPNVPWILEVSSSSAGFLGIGAKSSVGYETIAGFFYQPWMGSAVMSIIGFYFGQKVGK